MKVWGAVICFVAALVVLINFGKLDTWYLVLSGILTLVFLVVLPVLVLRSLSEIKRLNISDKTYKDVIAEFTKARKKLLMLQQIGIYSSFVFLFAFLPVTSKILSDKDFFMMEKDAALYGFLAVAFIFLILFARWGYGCYRGITRSAENILKDLE